MTSVGRSNPSEACLHAQHGLPLRRVSFVCVGSTVAARVCAGSILTSSKHALYEVVDVAEDDPEALWGALLAGQRLYLNTL